MFKGESQPFPLSSRALIDFVSALVDFPACWRPNCFFPEACYLRLGLKSGSRIQPVVRQDY